jgi:pantoate--beta-alanine ligase
VPQDNLMAYPRTLPQDVKLLEQVEITVPVDKSGSVKRTVSAVFAPSVSEMYPSGIARNFEEQKGTFVEVVGYGHQMEGMSRAPIFRGITTVVTKFFNVIQVNRPSSLNT